MASPQRAEQMRLYGTARWKKLRAVVLARDPVCKRCNNALSAVADHIDPIPVGADPADVAPSDCQGLCATCHGEKTREEQMAGVVGR